MVVKNAVCLLFLIGVCVELNGAGAAANVAQRAVGGGHVRARSHDAQSLRAATTQSTEQISEAFQQNSQSAQVAVLNAEARRGLNGWRALAGYVQQLKVTESEGVQNISNNIQTLSGQQYCEQNFGLEEGAKIADTALFVHRVCTFYNGNLITFAQVRDARQDLANARRELQTANNQVRTQVSQLKEQEKQLKEFRELQETFDRHKEMLTGELARSQRIYGRLLADVKQLNPGFAFKSDEAEGQIKEMLDFLKTRQTSSPQRRPANSGNQETPQLQPRASTGIGAATFGAGVFSLWSRQVGSTIAERLQSESAPEFLQNADKECLDHACSSVATVAVAGAAGALAMKAEERFLAMEDKKAQKKIINITRFLGLAAGAGVVAPKLLALAQQQPVVWEKYDTPLIVTSGTLLAATQRMNSAMLQTF